MSSIGKKIGDVLQGLDRARVVSEREYEIKDAKGRGTGVRVRDRALDLDGDGKVDVRVSRETENGRYTDTFEIENSLRFPHIACT